MQSHELNGQILKKFNKINKELLAFPFQHKKSSFYEVENITLQMKSLTKKL